MNFMTQLGVLIIIVIIFIIIVKSNEKLEKVYKESQNEVEAEEEKPIKLPKIDFPKIGKKHVLQKEEAKKQQEVGKPGRSMNTMPVEETPLVIELLSYDGDVEKSEKIYEYPYTIGRNDDNDFVIDDLSVSGEHAYLEREEDAIWLVDAGSLNKIIVDGKQEKRIPITNGVTVLLGNSKLRFAKPVPRSEMTRCYASTSGMEAGK